MSTRSGSRPHRPRPADRLSPRDEAAAGMPPSEGTEIAGLVAETAATRSGDDTRRRGWFWHWNSIVTQYAPLIGLKGVGLLNSYTVWTDRREESPHRGFAFPSQQSEADFYGEDRAELITINKLLVALDLIEIRKEMVLRVDEQGRRWKVPHNFYRVKDHGDGSGLDSRDVLRVAELADRDRAVYRYVRRVFSPKFSPIDRDNVWTQILADVRLTEVWQRLADRTAKEEQRASDRTRAGHAARKGSFGVPTDGDSAASPTTINDTATANSDGDRETSVAPTNNGFEPDVGLSNTGLDQLSTSDVARVNGGLATDVAQSNRTYNQQRITTTTTTEMDKKADESGRFHDEPRRLDNPEGAGQRVVTPSENSVTKARGNGPGGPAPYDRAAEAAAIRAFEAANGRTSTPAERQLLSNLAERFDPVATVARVPDLGTGWAWVGAAIYEAVDAGSAYVAPRRLREILARWERDGLPGHERDTPVARRESGPQPAPAQPGEYVLGEGPDLELPHGFGSRRTWAFAVSLLAQAIEPAMLAELVGGTAIAGYANGEVVISAPTSTQADRLLTEYGDLVGRKLGEAMRRPVRIAVTAPPDQPEAGDRAKPAERVAAKVPKRRAPAAADEELPEPMFMVAECGLPSGQVWAAVLDEVTGAGTIPPAEAELWLRATRLLGRGEDGRLIVGAMHTLAQRRIATRFATPLGSAVAAVLGRSVPIDIVVARDWLLAHRDEATESGAA